MQVSERVKKILDAYESDSPGTKANLARILMQGKLGGTGKLVILPVDQGFEHGPARSFPPMRRRSDSSKRARPPSRAPFPPSSKSTRRTASRATKRRRARR